MHSTKSSNLPKVLFRLLSTLDWDPHLTVLFFSSHSSKLEKANSFRRATTEYEYEYIKLYSDSHVSGDDSVRFFVRISNFGGRDLAIDN